MAALQFFLLGAPRLEQQHQSSNLSRRKAIAALAYLAVTRQPHSRDALATLLWPDQDQSGARANLRRDLSTLKQTLGDQTLLVDQSLVGLNPDADLWVDVDAFQAGLAAVQKHAHTNGHLCAECAAAVTAAVDLYTGDFMAGFSLPDSPAFDEWQFFEAERLRHLLAEALQRLIEWHIDQVEYEAAIAYARRWLALDALHEPAHRRLMQLYAWAGQHAAALRQYQECTRLLEEELGAPPDAETTALYEAIRTKQFPPPTTAPEAASLAAEPEPRERYRTERLLEVGGYGEVYLGRDNVTGQAVVIKRLKPELVAQDPAFVARFVREAEALHQLNHPNIVAILATVEEEGEQRIVMEYVPGGTLRDLLEQEGPLSYERSLDIMLELADALSRAHHLDIIHRDLKPDNVLLAADGTPRLMDFGMARLRQDDVRLTQPGMIVGSPAYLSPEALRGEELDARSDIWSFGVLLYELLAGHPPFEGQQLMTVLSNILHTPLPDIMDIRSDVPPALADLLRRMLAKDRDERIASMRLVAAELEAIRAGRPLKHSTSAQAATRSKFTLARRGTPSSLAAAHSSGQHDQQIHFCTAPDGVSIAYGQLGTGPLLIKAGNPLNHLEFDRQSPIWRHWWTGLANHYTFVRYDERGCGLSDWNVADFSMDAWVGDLETVVDQFSTQRFALLGVSQGASVAIAYAVRYPERVSHLILYGGYARGRFNRNPTPKQLEEARTLIHLIRVGWGQDNAAFRQVFANLLMPDGTPEQINWFAELARVSASAENAALMEMAFFNVNVTHLAPQVRVPTLVLHARHDAMCPFEEGRFMASLIPGARFVPLESNNHILLEHELAWPQFLSEVTQFTQTEPEPAVTISSAVKVTVPPTAATSQRELEQSIRFCQSADGVRLAYATIGAGPPLVKAANWLSHLEFDWQSPIWRHWLIGLAQHHTLIRYDERGCGLSDWNVDDFSFEAWVRDLEAVVDAAGVERFPLIGISQGGPIAVAYATRHPERVSHLILYGSYARGKLKRDLNADQIDEVEMLVKLIRLGWGRDNPAFRQVFTSMFIPDGTLEQYRWFNDLMRASASPENAARLVEGFNAIDVRQLAAQLDIPTLVLHARGDMRIPFQEGRLLASLIPGARLVTLESKNHILLEHEPAWQKFLSEVHEFLATPGRSIHNRAPAHPIDASPPITSAGQSAPHHNLPAPATPFIGREKELADIRALVVDDPACRLLTLVGPGGIGKTRLALVAAAESLDAFRDGATLVALATVGSADFILSALADALDFNLAGVAAPQDQVLNYLCDKQLLLIFDNFEHVLPGVELLADILLAAPQVKIVATSRERLNLQGEWIYEVPGMTFPHAADLPPADGTQMLEKYSAMRLFVQRARQTVANFVPTPADITAIAEICELVEGSPLAIELAAAWVNVLDCAAIAAEVQRGQEILTTQQRDIPEHHRSMQVVFDRTWERLTDDERLVFSRLSVFRGGFQRTAAQDVAEASLAILAALVNKSLLRWDQAGHYQVHELLRQYAAGQLARSAQEEQRSHERHCHYYGTLLADSFERYLDGRQMEATRHIEAEFGNILAAWSWTIARRRDDFIQQAIGPLWFFYEIRSRYLEGADMLKQALEFLTDQPRTEAIERSRVHTQVCLAWLHIRLGLLAEAEKCLTEALATYERLGIPPVAGVATDPRVALGILGSIRGDYHTMIRLGEAAVQLSEQYDHRWNRPFAYYLLARAAIAQGNYEQAQHYAQQASTAAQESKNRWFLAYCLIELGNVALAQDQFAQAKEHYQASYVIRQEFADREGMALALNRLATVIFRQQAYTEARSLYLQSFDLYRELDDKGGLASTLTGLGFVASGQADYGAAAQHFQQALHIVHELRFTPLAMWVLLGVGEMLLKTGQIERGVEMLGLVEYHPAAEREARLRARHCLDHFRDRLLPDEFTAIHQRGAQLNPDQVTETLLTDLLAWQSAVTLSAS